MDCDYAGMRLVDAGRFSARRRRGDARSLPPQMIFLTIYLRARRHKEPLARLARLARAVEGKMRVAWTSASGEELGRLLAAVVITCALVFSFACARAAAVDGVAGSKVLGIRFGGADGQTRMVIESDHSLFSRVALAQDDPRHIVISLSQVAPSRKDLDTPLAGAGFGFVKAWRIEATARGSRVLIELTSDCEITHRFALAPASTAASYRYVIDIAPATSACDCVGWRIRRRRAHIHSAAWPWRGHAPDQPVANDAFPAIPDRAARPQGDRGRRRAWRT